MAKRIIDVGKLRVGAQFFKLDITDRMPARKLETLITRELAKDATYGSYSCGACTRDVVDLIPFCPYCTAKFRVVSQPIVEEDEEMPKRQLPPHMPTVIDIDVDNTAPVMEPETASDDDDEDLAEWGDDMLEDDDWGGDFVAPNWGEDELADDPPEEIEEEKSEPLEETVDEKVSKAMAKKPRKTSQKTTGRPKGAKGLKSKAARSIQAAQNEKERERKRIQVLQDLEKGPYADADLKAFRRTALLMIASILGVHHPISLGNNTNIIAAIKEAQTIRFQK